MPSAICLERANCKALISLLTLMKYFTFSLTFKHVLILPSAYVSDRPSAHVLTTRETPERFFFAFYTEKYCEQICG